MSWLDDLVIRADTPRVRRRPVGILPRYPRKIGDGQASFAATTVLDRQPWRWDTNRFYARLGVSPHATRVEIAAAYIECDGYRSPALTYAFSVLVDKKVRPHYDALPFGTLWAQDPAFSVGLANDEFESAHLPDGWAYYLDADLDEAPAPDEWRSALAHALTGTALEGMGLCVGVTGSSPRIDVLGFNIVAYVPVDTRVTHDYALSIASELLAMIDQAEHR
jgi:hypothetical protein